VDTNNTWAKTSTQAMQLTAVPSMHAYEVRPRKDHRGVDLISDALPFGALSYAGPDCRQQRNRLREVSQPVMQCCDPRFRCSAC